MRCLRIKDPIWMSCEVYPLEVTFSPICQRDLWRVLQLRKGHVKIVCWLSFLSFSDFFLLFLGHFCTARDFFFFFCNRCLAREVWVKAYQLGQTPKNVWEVARYVVDCVEHAAVFFVSYLSYWEDPLPSTPWAYGHPQQAQCSLFTSSFWNIYIEREPPN